MESGIILEDPFVTKFRKEILAGNWKEVEGVMPKLVLSSDVCEKVSRPLTPPHLLRVITPLPALRTLSSPALCPPPSLRWS